MSAQVTEAHRKLACDVLLDHSVSGAATKDGVIAAAQLIADSEARAVVEIAMVAGASADRNVSLRLERDELRGALALGQQNCDDAYDDLRAERDAARAEVKRLKELHQLDEAMIVQRTEALNYETEATKAFCDDRNAQRARAERAEAEVERLKADGAASAFINMSCRASRAETDRNNLRADLDAIKAILNEEKARAERAEAELAAERARLRNVAIAACKEAQIKPMVWYPKGSSIDPNDLGKINEHQVEACVAAIDAAMKEGK